MRNEDDLRDTQTLIVTDLYECERRMVVAGMGGGKTAAALFAFNALQKDGVVRKGIILAPPKVAAMVWPREPAKWEELQHLKVVVVTGTPKQRLKLMEQDADLYVVALGVTKWLMDLVAEMDDNDPRLDLLAIDEVSILKGSKSKLAGYIADQSARFNNFWTFTGTVKPNGYEDLYNPYRALSAGKIWDGLDFWTWRRENFMSMDFQGHTWKVHRFAKPIIDKTVAKWTTAVDVELDLPPFNEGDDWNYEVELNADAREAYDEMTEHLLVELMRKPGDSEEKLADRMARLLAGDVPEEVVVALSAAVQSGKLSQIAQGFLLDRQVTDEGKEVSVLRAEYSNSKMELITELLETYRENGENVIVPYHFKQDLVNLKNLLGANVPYLGSGVSTANAAKVIDKWNEGRIPVLPVHPASMGHGVEMQWGGRNMLFYTPTWSSEQYDQLVKRIHRPGQTKAVFIRQIVAKDTVDEIKINRVQGKMDEQDLFIKMLAAHSLRRGA